MSQPKPLPTDPIAEAHRQWTAHGWGPVADGMAAVTSLMRAQQILLARVDEVLRPLDLTFARYELLMLLLFSRKGSLPLSRIGSLLQVHPTSVTSAVDRLEARGQVRRLPHPTDRRAILAEITEDGRATALAATEKLNDTVFADPGLPDSGVRDLVELLTDLRRGAGDF
ncbi:MarR family transcriptional regulator [Frankia sp. Mgl5]|uniref:MarR family transcriptional regulator n=1 Tax=Parafrankia soli TaxID=2599596 RepID=A0A1S1R410_9ACTN|nr:MULTISPECIES: MarR family transcriptional regulator [Frankiaceae]CAI7980458.1 Transcriptional regulator, MarR family [Frankia sp. Hr75.2]MCK9927025.1 MarR family transcriptional regulator [Frankia sp. Mgl5]OHV40509.1 MarR family transcriptional regulator [Parafrankia soli]TCJ36467.1 MarR family transcriptional regulator [Parafrankia sp. BMG5.11]SQD97924.1 Transcriptional regulator, MarR family [Parafrankia sp. Ea1.12]